MWSDPTWPIPYYSSVHDHRNALDAWNPMTCEKARTIGSLPTCFHFKCSMKTAWKRTVARKGQSLVKLGSAQDDPTDTMAFSSAFTKKTKHQLHFPWSAASATSHPDFSPHFSPHRTPWRRRGTRLCPAIPANGSRETWTSQPSSSMMARMRSPPWPTMPPPAQLGNLWGDIWCIYDRYVYIYTLGV